MQQNTLEAHNKTKALTSVLESKGKRDLVERFVQGTYTQIPEAFPIEHIWVPQEIYVILSVANFA